MQCRLNGHIDVVPYVLRLTSRNALDIFPLYDVIIDASDNAPTRYAAARTQSGIIGCDLVWRDPR